MKLVQLEGGLRTKLKLAWHYPPIEEFEEELYLAEKCKKEINYERFEWGIEDVRRHNRLMNSCELQYFPYMYPALDVRSKFGKFLWHIFCTSIKPDKVYLAQLLSAVRMTLPRIDDLDVQTQFLLLSECFLNVNWLHPELKRKFLTTFAKLVRRQTDLLYVTFENGRLTMDDGLRVLLTLSIGAGKTIEQLNLWHLFKKGLFPLKTDKEDDLSDPFVYDKEDEEEHSQDEKERIWKNILVTHRLRDIPSSRHHYLFRLSLMTFENVRVLNVHLSWLTYGQGKGLCQLGCVRNGVLRELHLLCTIDDLPEKTNQTISYHAWRQARSVCPKMRVHLVIFCVPEYDRNKQFLCEAMPLESYHLSTGYPCIDLKRFRHAWFDCILRTLIFRYRTQLRTLSLHIWHPRQMMDVIICRCLQEFHNLETFDYSGPLDKLDTLHEICGFVSKQQLRIKKLWLNIQEDPCASPKYHAAIREVYDEYVDEFYNRGIKFNLDTYRI